MRFLWFFDERLVQVNLEYFPKYGDAVQQLKQIYLESLVSLEILEYSLSKPYILGIIVTRILEY